MTDAWLGPHRSTAKNVVGVLLLIALFPVILLIKILVWPFERPIDLSAADVVTYLRDFIDGTSGDWDWDDFTSVPIADPALESVRERAAAINPTTLEAVAILRDLLSEAEDLAQKADRPRTTSHPTAASG